MIGVKLEILRFAESDPTNWPAPKITVTLQFQDLVRLSGLEVYPLAPGAKRSGQPTPQRTHGKEWQVSLGACGAAGVWKALDKKVFTSDDNNPWRSFLSMSSRPYSKTCERKRIHLKNSEKWCHDAHQVSYQCVWKALPYSLQILVLSWDPEVKKMQFMLPKDFKEFIRTPDSSDSKFLHQTSACFVGCFGACGSKQIIATGAAPPMRSASAVASCPQFIGKFQPVTSKIVRSSVKFLWEISRIRFPLLMRWGFYWSSVN
jgi:hypothetical protein